MPFFSSLLPAIIIHHRSSSPSSHSIHQSSKRKHKHNPTKIQHSRGTSRPRVAALTLGAWKPGVMSSALWPLDADAAAASQARMQPVQPPLRLPARFSYPVMVMVME
ncbi:hypothetical protein CI102_13360 [Trichoderma harzianum]|uniref:Uncharacterized protein n=1 Tax=Trichoderma harzianum CBS 226.95 TaxID=983964 RepID=A0A2T4A8K7_TRIHA|nr:hypothetical protein M431DRAFT_496695 [Trichoderma harzianum CBS 226.95]PKK41674.1 hypothetical protein CI102_13360 [Trichoderma harzianum]PTB53397.1 hypothetical protein M431DRAFT_496695 [Trichoderma harzianum CBS 226.95]